jgi:hypothetical protein
VVHSSTTNDDEPALGSVRTGACAPRMREGGALVDEDDVPAPALGSVARPRPSLLSSTRGHAVTLHDTPRSSTLWQWVGQARGQAAAADGTEGRGASAHARTHAADDSVRTVCYTTHVPLVYHARAHLHMSSGPAGGQKGNAVDEIIGVHTAGATSPKRNPSQNGTRPKRTSPIHDVFTPRAGVTRGMYVDSNLAPGGALECHRGHVTGVTRWPPQ